jgi:hypothetical protein
MTPAGFVALYCAIGATVATVINWRCARDTGRPLAAVDHLIGFGIAVIWPLVLVVLAWLAVTNRALARRP